MKGKVLLVIKDISKRRVETYHICNHKVKLFGEVLPPSFILCSSLAEVNGIMSNQVQCKSKHRIL
jgi:hypothetical protein